MADTKSFITHYGLFWSERDVLWNGKKSDLIGKEKGRLGRRGRPTKAEKDEGKSYGEFAGVYCLYRDGSLIYVGEAGLGDKKSTLFSRLKSHRVGPLADRWDEFSWFGCSKEHFQSADIKAADCFAQLEAILIAVTNPGYNKQAGTFAEAQQVFQLPDERADGDIETNLGWIVKQLEILMSRIPEPPPTIKKRGRKKKSATISDNTEDS